MVTLMRTTGGRAFVPGRPPQAQISQLHTETDDQGHFAFHDLEAGGYRVTVQRQGFVGQNGMPGVPAQNLEVFLGDGQQLTGYVVRTTPQSVIAGRVLDEYGDPIMGAQVFARRAGPANGMTPANANAGNAQSNDLGEYRIAGIGAGDYIVGASYQDRSRMIVPPNQQPSPDKPQLVYATTYHPATAVASEAAAVHVTGGAVVGGIDIKLAKITAYSVHLTVVDPGAPSNGQVAFPNLRPRDPTAMPGPFFGAQRQQDGSYLINGVPPGSYELTAQRNTNNPGTPGPAVSGNMPIDVRDRNLEGVVLEMKPNADLQGSVRLEQPGGCDANNLSVGLRSGLPGGFVYGPMTGQARVGDDLRFELKGVPPGVYAVSLMGNIGRCYVKSAVYRGQAAPADALTVTESGSLVVVLAAYSGQLSVTAVDRDGNLVPRARIMPVPKENGPGQTTVSGMTGPGGQITFGSIRPGTYDVYAFDTPDLSAPFYQPDADAMKAFEGRGKTVTVPQSGRATIEVTAIPASETGAVAPPPPPPAAKGSLAGRVVSAVNGSPIAGVVVTLRGQFNTAVPPRAPSASTDDQGRFSFPDLAPGQYSLMAAGQKFIAASLSPLGSLGDQVIVGEGQQVSAYILKLIPEGVIAGTLKDESGLPVLGARVQAFRYRNQTGERRLPPAGATQTDDLGSFRVANLGPGDYYIAVEPITPANPAVIRSNTFAGGPAMETTGQVTTGQIIAQPAAASQAPETITGPLPSDPESDYVPMWYPNAAQPSAATAVRLAAGATVANIEMTWRKTRVVRLRGKVSDPAGGAVGAPVLRLMPRGAQVTSLAIGSTRAARDGTFEISGVPAGSYSLIAWPGSPAGGGGRGGQVAGMAVMGGPGGPSNRVAVQPIDVKDSSIEAIDLEVSGGRTIKGSIKVDGAGSLPRPFFFSLRSEEGVGNGMVNMAGDGTFTLSNVFPVVYTLNSQNSQSLPANCYVKAIRYGGKDLPLADFELTGDGQLEVVVSTTAAVLEGSVTGADGKPAGLAGVVVAPVSGPTPVRMGNADANGSFYFANLPPGDYRVFAWDASTPEASDPPGSLTPFARYAKTVTLGASAHEKVQVTVAPLGR
jgi:hypothetical protein